MLTRTILLGLAATVTMPAFAAADLLTTIAAPANVHVYETGRYNVTIRNVGNADASNTTLTIQLPLTNTSPQVYVMGTTGAMSAGCARVGNVINCTTGQVKRNKSKTIFFDIAMPESIGALDITAVAATTSPETILANNTATRTATLLNYDVAFTAPRDTFIQHCTGTNLEAFFECTLFQGAIMSHTSTLNADFSVSVPAGGAGFTGVWASSGPQHLQFWYYDYGMLVATFEGFGVDSNCWEGLTTFGSPYVAPYEVCLN